MNKLSKEKRDQLILVTLVTVAVLIGLWFGLISFQKQHLKGLADRHDAGQRKLTQMQQAIKNVSQVEIALGEAGKRLREQEDEMASGDLNSWMYNTVRRFKLPYRVEIAQYSSVDAPKEMNMLPKFPYRQATIAIGGTGYFHDIGKFVADLENHFPHLRVLNMELEPNPAVGGTATEPEREKLSFKMEIVALVKPGGA